MSQETFSASSFSVLGAFTTPPDTNADTDGPRRIPLDKIIFSDDQPRDRAGISEEEIDNLVPSIAKHGVLQPILVRPLDNGNYELIAGERRYRASQKVGNAEIPAVVKAVSDAEAYEIALIENLQRKDLNAIERTAGILKLCSRIRDLPENEMSKEFYKLTHVKKKDANNVVSDPEWREIVEIFKHLGKELVSFAVHDLPMLDWPPEIQAAIKAEDIKPGHGRVIAKLKDADARKELIGLAVEEGLSVRALTEILKKKQAVNDDKLEKPRRGRGSNNEAHPLVQRMGLFCKNYKTSEKWALTTTEVESEVTRLQTEIEERLQRLEELLG